MQRKTLRFAVRYPRILPVLLWLMTSIFCVVLIFDLLIREGTPLYEYILPCMIFVALILVSMHYTYWKIIISNDCITICRLFFKKQTYRVSNISSIMGYSSGAEHGEVLWICFSDNRELKISHFYSNYNRFHSYIARKKTISWF